MKKHFIGLIVIGITLFSAATGSAATLFGPNEYIRTTGEPNVYSETFEAIPGEYYLVVTNGDENENNRVSSASIYINDVLIFEPNDFHHYTDILRAPVELSEINTIILNLNSTPGSYLTIEIKTYCPLIFGPGQFVRTTGKPNVYTETFIATPGEGFLTVINGDEDSNNRVSSASIYVNDLQVFEPKNFKNKDYILTTALDLSLTNSITVELSSNPGRYLNIEFCQKPPTVDLSLTPDTIIEGQSAELSWETDFALNASIDNGIGEVGLNDSLTVSPTETTTYAITATNVGASASDSTTLTVIPLPRVNLTATPATIIEGQSFDLSWTSLHADTVIIDNGINEVELNGTMPLSPIVNTTYTITATGPGGTTTSNVAVIVIPLPRVSINAFPETINYGDPAELSWIAEHAETVTIDNGIGDVELTGSLSVFPLEDTTYTIIATGPGGQATGTITIMVINPPPTITLSANPLIIDAGESFELTWATTNANSAIGQKATAGEVTFDEIPVSGSNILSPEKITTYTVIASGPGGTTSESITVEVIWPNPTVTISADHEEIFLGGATVLSWSSSFVESCSISSGVGNVEFEGTIQVAPAETTTYIITGTGPGGTATSEITVFVTYPPPGAIIFADPDTIFLGESVTLYWESFHAHTCEIDQGIGQVNANGFIDITPDETTIYSIVATGPGGVVSKNTTIEVLEVDLEPVGIDLSEVLLEPASMMLSGPVNVELKNNGSSGFNQSFGVTLFEDTNNDEIFDPESDNILGSELISGYPDNSINLNVPVELESNVVFKDNRVFVFVDCDHSIKETDEKNNITHNMLNCEHIPPVGSFNPVVEWSWSRTSPGISYVDSVPMVINLNDDNGDGEVNTDDIPDIVFISYYKWRIQAISGDGSGELFTIPFSTFSARIYSDPVVGDIDNDLLPEIIAIEKTGKKIAVFENDGTLKWISPTLENLTLSIDKSPRISLADIDQDGSPDIVYADHVLNVDGTIKWIGANSYGRGAPCVADIDQNGNPEIISGNTVYRSNGDLFWTNPAISDCSFCGIGNFDEDSFPEIVLVYKKVYLLEHTGQIVWSTTLPGGGEGGSPCIADYDNDGIPEIGVAGKKFYTVFEPDGSIKWQSQISDYSSHRTGSSVFDFEGDGSAEVVYADERYFRIYRGSDGAVLYELPNTSHTAFEYPVVADVDNDNNAEIIVPANGANKGLRIIGDANDTWVNTRKIWNQRSYCITNVNDDGTIPQYAANNWETFNSFHQNEMLNPFGCVDLSASMIRLDRSGLPEIANLIVRVGNGGALHVSSGIPISFYDGDPNDGGVLLGTTFTQDRIYPGQYEDVFVQWFNPPVEIKTVFVRADDNGAGTGTTSEVDEENNLSFATFNFGNIAPIADAGTDQAVIVEEHVDLDGSQSYDPDNDPITYEWSMIAWPEGSQTLLDSTNSVQSGFMPDVAGDYMVQLIVNDGIQDSGVDIIIVNASPPISVPDVTSISLEGAEIQILDVGLVVGNMDTDYSISVPEGCITSQFPVSGTIVALNTPVDLIVSSGVRKVEVPDLTGMLQLDAESEITDTGLTIGTATEKYIDTQPVGHACGQSPEAGRSVPIDTPINISLSLGTWSGPDTEPPNLTITPDHQRIDLGGTVTLTVLASDNVGVTNVSLSVDGNPLALAENQAQYLMDRPGFITAEATAEDAAGHLTSKTTIIEVSNPFDTIPPTAILSETDCVDVTDLYDVMGEVSDTSGVIYSLSARPSGSTAWKQFAQGSGNSIYGALGTFDPTVLRNGVYEILLSAEDLAGNTASDTGCVLLDGQLKVGHVILPGMDANIPNNGFPLALEREYDSRDEDGDFGPGWSLPASKVKPQPTRELNAGWAEEVGGSFMTTYYLIEKYSHVVVIRFSDEEMLKFKMDVTPKSSVLTPIAYHSNLKATYVPIDGTVGTLEALNVANNSLMLIGDQLREWGTDLYEPKRFKYTRPDGTCYVLHMENGIESIADVYGNSVSYDDAGIHHSSGASIAFTRGTGNRIETITDPFGLTIEYHYDENGMLEQVVKTGTEPFAVRKMDKYGYAQGIFEKPVLKDIKAPDGTILGQFEYDSQGRMTVLIDADGNKIIYGFDLSNHTQEITDRNGNTSTYEYNAKGYVTRKEDPDGNVTLWTYNVNGDKLTETNPLGITSAWTYDESGNMLTETDPLGNTTTYTYNERNDVLTQTDPNGNIIANVYDAQGNLLEKTDALGNVTAYTHDTKGNVLTETDALGNVTTFEYNFYGHRTKEIAPSGKVTEWSFDRYGNELSESVTRTTETGETVTMTTTNEYDIRHRLTRTVDAMGNETRTEYNYLDKESVVIDKNGACTEFEYDVNANQTAIRYADGTSMETVYDEEGNRTSTTDRAGRTTDFEYDKNNQMTRVIYPDSSSSEIVLDESGRMIATIDENGNQTDFVYDVAGRRMAVIDALNSTVFFDYDAASNQTSMTDPKGAITYYEYDALNRQVKTVYPDGTYSETEYDALGRKVSETDPAGNSTYFDYDSAGNLTSVTDALGNITQYSYDEMGNRLSHTDPNGNTEYWAYDDPGWVISHTLPLGMTETYTYDPMGNVLTHTDFNGDTITYEYSPCCGRLTQKTNPDDTSVEFTYLGDGKRETVTDSRGVTRYIYDDRSRLESVTNPDGSVISYMYDAKGNRTSVTVPSGTTTYTFDALNRLATVTDPSGGVTAYSYDDNGNREQVINPNGTIAEYTYDTLNRLIYLENRTSAGDVISCYFYTLGPTGNRLSVSENTGRVMNYTYD
ncbi:MAG: PASTA domain-containing protein, partial [Desulfobacteraceae bacterium]|nr:PASTA domain-containing protein [Desulfobacteraceae bacterium]MBC2757901.1 PASTA domain-containing protein [Desulfobacteraceae bacterium]